MFFFSRKAKGIFSSCLFSLSTIYYTTYSNISNFKSYTGINGQLRSMEGNGGRSLQATT